MLLNKSILKRLPIFTMFILISVFITSCEDVIQVDLDEVEPRIVIEAYVIDNPSLAAVIITETTDFYNLTPFPMVSGATAIISDDAGNVDTLFPFEAGVYVNPYIEVETGRTYHAEVTVAGVTYTAQAAMPEPIKVDSLVSVYQPGGGFGDDEEEGYRLHVYFTDYLDIHDYCRLKVQANDSILTDYYLYDGQYSDGNSIDYNYFGGVFQLGDTLFVDIFTMDEITYDYYSTMVNVVAYTEAGEYNGEPGNPISNWDNDALGYFGVFTIRSDTLIVTESETP
jgi:hypothetical protein